MYLQNKGEAGPQDSVPSYHNLLPLPRCYHTLGFVPSSCSLQASLSHIIFDIVFPLPGTQPSFPPFLEFIYTQLWVSVQRSCPSNSWPSVHISEFLSFRACVLVESWCLVVCCLFTNIQLLTQLKFYLDGDYVSVYYCSHRNQYRKWHIVDAEYLLVE